MNSLIEKYLKKYDIDVKDLDDEERAALEQWDAELRNEVTVDKMKEYCHNQLSSIERQWRNMDNSVTKNERLLALHTAFKMILDLFDQSRRVREEREAQIRVLLHKE